MEKKLEKIMDGRNGKMAKRNGEKGLYNGKGKITRGGISTVFYCRLKSRLSEGGGGGWSGCLLIIQLLGHLVQ
jgi:hypothetical protein